MNLEDLDRVRDYVGTIGDSSKFHIIEDLGEWSRNHYKSLCGHLRDGETNNKHELVGLGYARSHGKTLCAECNNRLMKIYPQTVKECCMCNSLNVFSDREFYKGTVVDNRGQSVDVTICDQCSQIESVLDNE
jgi:hypothetical protein